MMGSFLNRDQAQSEQRDQKTAQIEAENEKLKLRVEILEGQLEQYAIQKAQLEVELLMLAAKIQTSPLTPLLRGAGEGETTEGDALGV